MRLAVVVELGAAVGAVEQSCQRICFTEGVNPARGLTELLNQIESSEVLKSHYNTATQNAQSAAEKRFYADKEAALDKMMSEINPLTFNDVLGTAMLSEASEWVGMDKAEKAGDFYFHELKQPRLPSMEEVNPWFESIISAAKRGE